MTHVTSRVQPKEKDKSEYTQPTAYDIPRSTRLVAMFCVSVPVLSEQIMLCKFQIEACAISAEKCFEKLIC